MPKLNNTELIIQYMLKQIKEKNADFVKKTLETFPVSRSTVYNYLKKMIEECIVKTVSDEAFPYCLVDHRNDFIYRNERLSEDKVFDRDIAPLLDGLPGNVVSAWRYAFTEMMNNAIEHSDAAHIRVRVSSNAYDTTVMISDDGIGIFRNIRQYMEHEKNETLTLKECAALLFCGKFTTASELHSGEGIFFTSHLMDDFIIVSDDVVFCRDNFNDSVYTDISNKQGTLVMMRLHNHSQKTVTEVFDRFSDVEHGFYKTLIPIAHIFTGGSPVSRSEARRLGEMLLDFGEITLDFADVPEIGQAFTHELFVVWQKRHPEITLLAVNAQDAVKRMIERVKNTK